MGTTNLRGRIRELDGLRGISVLFVIIFHLTCISEAIPSSPSFFKVASFLGPTGVEIFFIISGFIITKLMMEEFHLNGSISMSRFYVRRFFRIIPAYWFYTLAVCVLGCSGMILLNGPSVLWSLLFLSNTTLVRAGDDGSWFLGQTWSLSVEEQYYLLFPALIWVVLRGNVKSTTIALAFFYLVAVMSYKVTSEVQTRYPATGFNICFLSDFKFIIAGVLIALHRVSLGGWARRTNFVFLLALASTLCVGRIVLGAFHGIDLFFDFTDAVIMAFIVLWILENPLRCGWLLWAPLLWLGECSYSLYLWQQLFTGRSSQYIALRLNLPPYCFFLILGCGAFSLYFIERPFIRLGRTILQKWDTKIVRIQTAVEPSV